MRGQALFIFTLSAVGALGGALEGWKNTTLELVYDKSRYSVQAYVGDTGVGMGIAKQKRWGDAEALCKTVARFMPGEELNTCVDVGANIGAVTLLMDHLRCKKILALEPIFYNILNETLALNGLSDKVIIETEAVGDRIGTIEFEVNPENVGGTKIFTTPTTDKGLKQVVKVNLFASILRRHGIQEIDLLKIDIEGAELELLKTSMYLFKQKLVKGLLLENHHQYTLPARKSELISYFDAIEDSGYTLFCIDSKSYLKKSGWNLKCTLIFISLKKEV